MKTRKNAPFIEELFNIMKSLKKIKPNEVHVISVNANYGHYQILIGPIPAGYGKKKHYLRPIEINGEIHHLFLTPKNIRPYPSKKQVLENLKHTLVMRNLNVRIKDPVGDGRHIKAGKNEGVLHANDYINLAGEEGMKLLDKIEHTKQHSLAAYRIVQRDIIESLKQKNKAA